MWEQPTTNSQPVANAQGDNDHGGLFLPSYSPLLGRLLRVPCWLLPTCTHAIAYRHYGCYTSFSTLMRYVSTREVARLTGYVIMSCLLITWCHLPIPYVVFIDCRAMGVGHARCGCDNSEFCCGAAAAVVTVAIAMTWRPLSHSNDGGGRCHTAMIVRGSGFDARSARVRHTRTSA